MLKTLDKYYKGHTNNVENRLKRHNAGSEILYLYIKNR